MKKKRLIVIVTSLLLLMTTVPVMADTSFDNETPQIGIMSAYSKVERATLSISTSGTAKVTGILTGYSGTTTKVSATIYLQQYRGGNWVNIASKSETANSYRLTTSMSKSVSKGYKYRTKASFYAYKGSNKDHFVKYSSAVTY